MTDKDRMTQEALVGLLIERFGSSPMDWAFVCPNCGDVATYGFRPALAKVAS